MLVKCRIICWKTLKWRIYTVQNNKKYFFSIPDWGKWTRRTFIRQDIKWFSGPIFFVQLSTAYLDYIFFDIFFEVRCWRELPISSAAMEHRKLRRSTWPCNAWTIATIFVIFFIGLQAVQSKVRIFKTCEILWIENLICRLCKIPSVFFLNVLYVSVLFCFLTRIYSWKLKFDTFRLKKSN